MWIQVQWSSETSLHHRSLRNEARRRTGLEHPRSAPAVAAAWSSGARAQLKIEADTRENQTPSNRRRRKYTEIQRSCLKEVDLQLKPSPIESPHGSTRHGRLCEYRRHHNLRKVDGSGLRTTMEALLSAYLNGIFNTMRPEKNRTISGFFWNLQIRIRCSSLRIFF